MNREEAECKISLLIDFFLGMLSFPFRRGHPIPSFECLEEGISIYVSNLPRNIDDLHPMALQQFYGFFQTIILQIIGEVFRSLCLKKV